MLKVETYLYDAHERRLFEAAIQGIELHRAKQQVAMQGNTEPGRRVPETVVAEAVPAAPTEPTPIPLVLTHTEKVQEALAAVMATHGETLKKLTDSPLGAPVDPKGVLQAYVTKHGIPKAQETLGKYGAKRLGDVPSDKLSALVAELQAAL